MEDYPPQKHIFQECVEMHKEAAQPAMTNTLHSQIYADMRLNMSTTKKTKFMKNIRGLLEFPHTFQHQQKKNIFIFSENPADWDRCRELGATQAGGDDIIGFINQGIIRKDDIEQCDFIFATPNMAVKLLKMRSVLQDKTPTLKNGCITDDFEALMQRYNQGVRYKSHKEGEAFGRVQVPFGQLNQDTVKLEENFKYMVDILSQLKSKNLDPLIDRIQLIAPPSTEIFDMNLEGYVKPKVTKAQEREAADARYEDSDEED